MGEEYIFNQQTTIVTDVIHALKEKQRIPWEKKSRKKDIEEQKVKNNHLKKICPDKVCQNLDISTEQKEMEKDCVQPFLCEKEKRKDRLASSCRTRRICGYTQRDVVDVFSCFCVDGKLKSHCSERCLEKSHHSIQEPRGGGERSARLEWRQSQKLWDIPLSEAPIYSQGLAAAEAL